VTDLERATGLALSRFAVAFGMEVSEACVAIYAETFSDEGLTAIQVVAATRYLLRTHRFRSIPTPADWIEASAAVCSQGDAAWRAVEAGTVDAIAGRLMGPAGIRDVTVAERAGVRRAYLDEWLRESLPARHRLLTGGGSHG